MPSLVISAETSSCSSGKSRRKKAKVENVARRLAKASTTPETNPIHPHFPIHQRLYLKKPLIVLKKEEGWWAVVDVECFAPRPVEEEVCCRLTPVSLSLLTDTCSTDGLRDPLLRCCFVGTRVRVVLVSNELVRSPGPSICYSMPYCFFACSKFSRRACKSSFDRTILSGWW